ncbi:hypothetical protein [Bradyrhizobium sp. STM 3562]|uniref:hypothetical protein n=1 Tax=Bradyrhizobium sp. STM 3562 TaxID=578924 RepID=UPI003890DB19
MRRALDCVQRFRDLGANEEAGNSRPPRGQINAQSSFTVPYPNEFMLPAAERWRLLDDEPAQLTVPVDQEALGQLEQVLRAELQPRRTDQPAPLALFESEHFAVDLVQFSPDELWQLLDDEPAPLVAGSGFAGPSVNEPGPSLSFYAPPGWQHGQPSASEQLGEMPLQHVLPSISAPEDSLALLDVNYTPAELQPRPTAQRSQAQQTVSEERQRGRAGHETFDQQVRQARLVDVALPAGGFLPDDLCRCYPHLSDTDRRFIERTIGAAVASGEVDATSGTRYANNLASLANSLGHDGLSMASLSDNELSAYVKAGYNRGSYVRRALDCVQRFRDLGTNEEAGNSRPPRGQINSQSSFTVPYPNEFMLPAAKRRRLLDDEPAPLVAGSGLTDPSVNEPGPSFSLYAPPAWQHGQPSASEQLEEMRLHGVLPSVSDPEKNLALHGVNYTPAELQPRPTAQPAPFALLDPEHFPVDFVQFSPDELRQLLDDEPGPSVARSGPGGSVG